MRWRLVAILRAGGLFVLAACGDSTFDSADDSDASSPDASADATAADTAAPDAYVFVDAAGPVLPDASADAGLDAGFPCGMSIDCPILSCRSAVCSDLHCVYSFAGGSTVCDVDGLCQADGGCSK